MSRHMDSSTTTQMAKIMVQYGRPSRSSWTKSVWSSFGRIVMGKTIWKNPCEIRLRESFLSNGNAYSYTVKKDYSYLCMWKTSHWLERNKILIRCGKYETKKLIWEDQHRSLIMTTWDVLKDNVKWAKMLLTISEPCLNPEFPLDQQKNTMLGKSVYLFVLLWHRRSCQEMCGTILWVGKQDDSTTLQSISSMPWWPSLQRRRNEICWRSVTSMLSNCSEILKLGTYWTTWYSIYGQWTNLHVRSQSGPKPVTNAWIDWSPTFITQVNTNNIVMWETLENDAHWDCSKTPILQEILKIKNLCVRNKLQLRTVQQNQQSFLWMQDSRWTENPHLI